MTKYLKNVFLKLTSVAVTVAMFFSVILPAAAVPYPNSENAVLIDATTGQVLYGKSEDATINPSGLVKIMTAVLACESTVSSSEKITVTRTALSPLGTGYRSMGLKVDEIISFGDLICGMLLNSANDAANVIAEKVGGTVDAFVDLMNVKAEELGMEDTNFANPNGLAGSGQVSTVGDMAILLKYAFTVDGFADYFGMQECTIPATNISTEVRTFSTRCALARVGSDQYYEGSLGGVIGFSNDSYVTACAADKNGRRLIVVDAGVSSDTKLYADVAMLFNYGFDEFTAVEFDGEEFDKVEIPLTENNVRIGTAVFKLDAEKISVLLENGMNNDSVEAVMKDIPAFYDRNSTESYTADICYNNETESRVLLADVPLKVEFHYDSGETTADETGDYTGPIYTDENGNPMTDENGNLVTGTSETNGGGSKTNVFKKFIKTFLKVLLIIIIVICGAIILLILFLYIRKSIRRYIRRKKRAEAAARKAKGMDSQDKQ